MHNYVSFLSGLADVKNDFWYYNVRMLDKKTHEIFKKSFQLGLIIIGLICVSFLMVKSTLKHRIDAVFPTTKEGKMKLTSTFSNGEKIPHKFTCDGDDVSPELVISNVPKEAKSLALVVDDPDAPLGNFNHWLLYNIPVGTTKISSKNIPPGAHQGVTDFGKASYGGPCPPYGTHRYFFRLFAVDKVLDLPPKVTKSTLQHAIRDHVVEKTELVGLYSRSKH